MKKTTLALIFSSLALSSAMGQATPINHSSLANSFQQTKQNSITAGVGLVGGFSAGTKDDKGQSHNGVGAGVGAGFNFAYGHKLSTDTGVEVRASHAAMMVNRSYINLSLTATQQIPLSSKTYLVGKAGLSYLNVYHSILLAPDDSSSFISPEIGAGIGFKLANDFSTSIEFNAPLMKGNAINHKNYKNAGIAALGLISINTTYEF